MRGRWAKPRETGRGEGRLEGDDSPFGEAVAIAPIIAPMGDGPGFEAGFGPATEVSALGAASPRAARRRQAVNLEVGGGVVRMMTGNHCRSYQ